MILIMSLVLCGVLALSAPVFGEKGQQASKTATTTVKVALVKTCVSTSAPKSEFVRGGWRDGLRFYLRNWFGRPSIPVLDPKPSVPDEPLKSSTDPNRPRLMDSEKMSDHGGSDDV